MIFLFPYIVGPLIGGLAAAGLLKLSEKITIESERFEEEYENSVEH